MHKSVNSIWMVDISLNWEYSQLKDYSNIKIDNIDDQPLFHTWLLVHHEDTQDQPKVQENSHNTTSYTKAASENSIILFACPPQILLQVSLETYNGPKRKQKQCLCKIWGDKQRVLWYLPKWPMKDTRPLLFSSNPCTSPFSLSVYLSITPHSPRRPRFSSTHFQ